MNRTEITALAEGLVPFVREVVADGTAPLAARLNDLEARPGDIGLAPDDIAKQIAGAVRMLAEAPPIVRDAKSNNETVVIAKGKRGPRGLPGLPGPQGDRGDPGPRGRDGTGIAGAAISREGNLLLTLSDGAILTLALDKVTDNA